MKKASSHFETREVKKGEYFFHEGEPSKFFAGLIKGRICFKKSKIFNRETGEVIYRPLYRAVEKKEDMRNTIRKLTKKEDLRGNKIKQNMELNQKQLDPKRISVYNLPYFSYFRTKGSLTSQPYKIVKEYFDPQYYRVVEEELFQADSGYCFGEWALIYNQPRSASVIALEDSVFFILDEKIFSKTFLKCLNSSEHKKKKFILENLFPFNLYNERRNSLYKDIVPKSVVRNQIIFNEGDIADTIYLIYTGTFILEKYYKNKLFRFKSVEKGSILGLESLFEEEGKYRCTLKLSSLNEFGVVASCKVSKLVPYILKKMKSIFKNNYALYIESNDDFYHKNVNYENNILLKIKSKEEETEEAIEKCIEDYSLMEKKEKLKNKKIQFNTLKQVKLDKNPSLSKTERNLKTDNSNSKKDIRTKKKARTLRKKKKAKTIKLKKITNYDDFNFQTEKIPTLIRRSLFRKTKTIIHFSKKIKLNKENNESNFKTIFLVNNTKTNTEVNQNQNITENKTINENEKNNDIKIKNIRRFNIDKYIKDLLSYNYKPNIIEDLKEKSKNNKNKRKIPKILNKTFYNFHKRKPIEKHISRNEQYEENIDNQITNFTELPTLKYDKDKKFKFDSGKYTLPLLTQIFN